MPTTPATSPARPFLALLTSIPKAFDLKEGATMENPELVLVDEKIAEKRGLSPAVWKDWTRDELVTSIVQSLPDFASLIRELHEYKTVQINASEGLLRAFYMATRIDYKEEEHGNPLEGINKAITKLRQAEDVLTNIAMNVPADKAKEVAVKFISHDRAVVEGIFLKE